MTVGELRRDVVFVSPDSPLEEAALALDQVSGRHLPVLEGGRVLGVVHRSHLEAQGAMVDGRWLGWGTARTARDLLTVVPQVRLVSSASLQALLDALLEHTCVVIVDEHGHLVDLFTDTDGVQEALPLLDDLELARTLTSPLSRTIRADAPAWAAMREMRRCDVRHLVVLDAHQPAGVVSIRDLEVAAADDARRLEVADVIDGRPAITASAECSAREAAELMLDHGIGCVPLVDAEGFLVAVVTRRDLIRAVLPRAGRISA